MRRICGSWFYFCVKKEVKKMKKKIIALLLALVMVLALAACGSSNNDSNAKDDAASNDNAQTDTNNQADSNGDSADEVASGVEDGVLTVAMECAYAPYNWTQTDDSNGAVEISNAPGEYANGYDVMIAKKICEANNWELEIIRTDWNSLVPGIQTGLYDAVIAGQSMTAERSEQVDFAGPYFYASIVCVTKADGKFANAKGISELSGGTCTAQIETIWYDSCLPQIDGAKIQTASETAPAMLMALETDTVDFICTDMPTAMGAVAVYPDMKILDFSGVEDNFVVDEGEINIGVSVMKGNTVLKNAIDSVLSTMSVEDFNNLMNEAIAVQPLSQD